MLLFDAHLDLAMNALEWNRDYTRPLTEIRQREASATDKPDRGKGTVSFEEMRKAGIGLCVATQIARFVKPVNSLPGWHSPQQAWAQTQGQLAWYRAMEAAEELVSIRSRTEMDRHLSNWEAANCRGPIGFLLSLEGADSIVSLRHLEQSWENGLRAVGPAHYGPGTYAQGTDATGGIGQRGRDLLREMSRLGIILDAAHLCDESFWEAMEVFHGEVWASHANCRALVPHNRQLSDDQIKALLDRDAVIGVVFDAWMIVPDWVRGKTKPSDKGLKMEHIVRHIDHICQLAGNARHVGIGSDLDGAFGYEQTPQDLTSIADLATLPQLLGNRGYSQEDVLGIMHGNFVRFLRNALPS